MLELSVAKKCFSREGIEPETRNPRSANADEAAALGLEVSYMLSP